MRLLLVALRGLLGVALLFFTVAAVRLFVQPEFRYQSGDTALAFRMDAPLPARCFELHWETQNAVTLLLDTQPVAASGVQSICPISSSNPEFTVTFNDGGTQSFSRLTLWNATGTRIAFFLSLVGVLLMTFYAVPSVAAGGAAAGLISVAVWLFVGMPPVPVLSIREAFFASTTLLNQVFLIALVVPVLYRSMPVRWRSTLLLGVSLLMLLRSQVSVEYISILAILICLTWIVVAPAPEAVARPVSSLQLRAGLVCIVAFSLTLALFQHLPVTGIPGVLAGFAAAGGTVIIVGLLLSERQLLRGIQQWGFAAIVLAGVNLAFAPLYVIVTRFSSAWSILLLLAVGTVLCCVLCLSWAARASISQRRQIAGAGIVLVIVLFILFKLPADGVIFRWFGFSYIAFRLLHVLLDSRMNIELPVTGIENWSLYTLFFSAQAVGPIDRWERFATDVQAQRPFTWGDYVTGWERILWGGVKKFFIADMLLRGLTPGFIPLPLIDSLYAWFQLYVYAFYLYCDFSGFVDIAIGTARLVGFHLPENFDRPYTRGSLAQFWQSWHITLSSWLRAYVFLPLTRSLLRTKLKRNVLFITLIANLVTMSLIGLWHGFTWNFLAWGIWHAIGLFIHKVFSDRTRRIQMRWKNTWRSAVFHVFSLALTFHFVVAGWVFFALPSFEESLRYLALMAGIRL